MLSTSQRVAATPIVVAIVLAAQPCWAADWTEACLPTLTPNRAVDVHTEAGQSYLRDTMCVLDFQSFGSQFGASASGSYALISGGASFSKGNYDNTRHKLCTDRTVSDANSAYFYSSRTIIPEQARRDFELCLNAQSLACLFDAEDPPNLEIHYAGTFGPGTVTAVKPDNVTITTDNLKVGATLPAGEQFVGLNNINRHMPSKIAFNVSIGTGVASCQAYLPAKFTPPSVSKIAKKLVGVYEVKHGPKERCIGEKPETLGRLRILSDGRDLWVMDECEDLSPVTVAPGGNVVEWFNSQASLSIDGDNVTIINPDQNAYRKHNTIMTPPSVSGIAKTLVGVYEVKLGTKERCIGAKLETLGRLRILSDGRDLWVMDECEDVSPVTVAQEGNAIDWFNVQASIKIDGDNVTIVNPDGNSYRRTNE
jgi:hypothetical protein